MSVSSGLCEYFDNHDNKHVLYPTPDEFNSSEVKTAKSAPWKIVYTGSLWDGYGRMLIELAHSIANHDTLDLKLFGDSKYIPAAERATLEVSGVLKPKIPSLPEYLQTIDTDADLLLVVASFEEAESLRMQTSIPSKLFQYVQSRTPVLAWAPETSSLGQFFSEKAPSLWVKDADPRSLIKKAQEILGSPTHYQDAQEQCTHIAKTCAHPKRITEKFDRILNSLNTPKR